MVYPSFKFSMNASADQQTLFLTLFSRLCNKCPLFQQQLGGGRREHQGVLYHQRPRRSAQDLTLPRKSSSNSSSSFTKSKTSHSSLLGLDLSSHGGASTDRQEVTWYIIENEEEGETDYSTTFKLQYLTLSLYWACIMHNSIHNM